MSATERVRLSSAPAGETDRRTGHERRLAALDAFIAEFEAAHGVIADDEMNGATRRLRDGPG